MKERIANLVSTILNPFLVSLTVVLLLSLASTATTLEAIKWVVVALAIGELPVFSVIFYLVRRGRLDAIFTTVRQQRTKIYIVGNLFCAIGLAVLICFRAPLVLVAAFAAVLVAGILFMFINLRWKISLHVAFVAGAATALVIVLGWIAGVGMALVPVIAWARIELKHHSPAEAATGALLAIFTVLAVFCPLLLG